MRRFLHRYQPLLVTVIVVVGFYVGGGLLLYRSSSDLKHGWHTDFSRTSVPLAELIPVAGRDALVPIDHPVWRPVANISSMSDLSPVIVVDLAQPARAYPLAVLLHHGVVNDHIGTTAIAVTYCALCNSPIVYNRRVHGDVLRLGTTGALHNSGLVLWDDRTQSWWRQFNGQAIVGFYRGTRLEMLPSQLVGLGQFRERFPDGMVLAGDAYLPAVSYGRNPYIGYDSSPQPLLFVETPDRRLPPTERVLAGVINGQPVAYPFSVLARHGVVNDTVGGWPVVAFWHHGTASALDHSRIDHSRDVGSAALFSPVVDGHRLTFERVGGRVYDAQTGSQWNLFGEAISGPLRGGTLQQYAAQPLFWFAWAANYPATLVYTDSAEQNRK